MGEIKGIEREISMDHLTISKAKIIREQLMNELELYLEQKEINFIKTQPTSPVMRDIIEGKSDGFKISDKLTHYLVKDEQLDEKIFALQKSINSYEKFIINEMERINKAGGHYLIMGRAQGVAMAAALYRDIPIFEYSPKTIKQNITGNGNASKEQVAKMVHFILKTDEDPKFFDATDAVAAAVCHSISKGKDVNYTKHTTEKAKAHRKPDWSKFIAENPERIKS